MTDTDDKKLKLIEFIINDAYIETIDGLHELLIQNDFLYAIELLDKAYGGQIKKELAEEFKDNE